MVCLCSGGVEWTQNAVYFKQTHTAHYTISKRLLRRCHDLLKGSRGLLLLCLQLQAGGREWAYVRAGRRTYCRQGHSALFQALGKHRGSVFECVCDVRHDVLQFLQLGWLHTAAAGIIRVVCIG